VVGSGGGSLLPSEVGERQPGHWAAGALPVSALLQP
jgi:hypothetical protein